MAQHSLKIALTGNPNSGKSSLFNALTGLRQKVSNYPGVTVDKKTGTCFLNKNQKAEIIDLPGTYSIYPKSADEQIVLNLLCNTEDEDHPDMIIAVVDASSLKRNLLFVSQIMDLKIPVIVALNMVDIAKEKGAEIDVQKLSELLGIKVIAINARANKGIDELKKAILVETQNIASSPLSFGEGLGVRQYFIGNHFLPEKASEEIKRHIQCESEYGVFQIANHYQKLYFFNSDKKENIRSILQKYSLNFHKQQGEETLKRYEKINSIISTCVVQQNHISEHRLTVKLDKIFTHKIWGYFIFLLIMFVVFQSIFNLAKYPMDWVDNGFSALSFELQKILPKGWFADLLTQGVLAGISAIAIFIPQIMILFGFLTILEDTGYLARVSFITDKLMQKIGMNGKSVIPLMSGFACAVPAIMSARNIENRKERIITILVTPLMSCSARLPVYTLLIGMVVPDKFIFGVFNLQGLAMMGMYLLGVVAAIVISLLMRLFVQAKEKGYFIMELPVYRSPRWENIFYTMFEKAKIFAVDAGKVILAISIVLWFLASFGPGNVMEEIENKHQSVSAAQNSNDIQTKIQSEKLEASYAGIGGKWIEPLIQPLGFDWKIGIALITSFAAREVFVGTMATIYSVGNKNPDIQTVKEKMVNSSAYSLATAFSLMIFYAFAMQCMSTVAIVKRETKSWKWAAIMIAYMTVLAYGGSLLVYQILK